MLIQGINQVTLRRDALAREIIVLREVVRRIFGAFITSARGCSIRGVSLSLFSSLGGLNTAPLICKFRKRSDAGAKSYKAISMLKLYCRALFKPTTCRLIPLRMSVHVSI